eukprot:gene4905-8494_t
MAPLCKPATKRLLATCGFYAGIAFYIPLIIVYYVLSVRLLSDSLNLYYIRLRNGESLNVKINEYGQRYDSWKNLTFKVKLNLQEKKLYSDESHESFSKFEWIGDLNPYSPLKFKTNFSTSSFHQIFEVYKKESTDVSFQFIKKINTTKYNNICLKYNLKYNETKKENITLSDALDSCGNDKQSASGRLEIVVREESDPMLYIPFQSSQPYWIKEIISSPYYIATVIILIVLFGLVIFIPLFSVMGLLIYLEHFKKYRNFESIKE